MTPKEKIEMIECVELRDKLADAIAEDIFQANNLEEPFLKTWLADNIRKQSLADIILGDQKVYVIRLAKKIATDICFIEQASDSRYLLDYAIDNYGELGDFVRKVIAEYGIEIDEFSDEVIEVSKQTDYADTIIVDECAYVFDNDTEKKVCYKATICTKHRTNYGLGFFRKRVENRMAYHWKNCKVKLIEVFEENGKYNAEVTFLTTDDYDTTLSNLNYRFGAKSGRPWKNSVVANLTTINPIV